MASKLEKMMKEDGWILGYEENWGCQYWIFRKGDFEIRMRDISRIDKKEEDHHHFKKWRKE